MHSVHNSVRIAKISILNYEGIKKNYECCVYESVHDRRLFYVMSLKPTKK